MARSLADLMVKKAIESYKNKHDVLNKLLQQIITSSKIRVPNKFVMLFRGPCKCVEIEMDHNYLKSIYVTSNSQIYVSLTIPPTLNETVCVMLSLIC